MESKKLIKNILFKEYKIETIEDLSKLEVKQKLLVLIEDLFEAANLSISISPKFYDLSKLLADLGKKLGDDLVMTFEELKEEQLKKIDKKTKEKINKLENESKEVEELFSSHKK